MTGQETAPRRVLVLRCPRWLDGAAPGTGRGSAQEAG